MKQSKELKAFVDSFNKHMGFEGIHAKKGIEDKDWFHWKRVPIDNLLNQADLMRISDYINETFTSPGNFSHLLPKIHYYNGDLVLTVDAKQIKEFIL